MAHPGHRHLSRSIPTTTSQAFAPSALGLFGNDVVTKKNTTWQRKLLSSCLASSAWICNSP